MTPDDIAPAAAGAPMAPGEDPIAQFESWLAEATRSEPNDPNAMTLATADASGAP